MGSVLVFSRKNVATGRKQAGDGKPATIVIFPGVRYERPAEVKAGMPVGRDRLERPAPAR